MTAVGNGAETLMKHMFDADVEAEVVVARRAERAHPLSPTNESAASPPTRWFVIVSCATPSMMRASDAFWPAAVGASVSTSGHARPDVPRRQHAQRQRRSRR